MSATERLALFSDSVRPDQQRSRRCITHILCARKELHRDSPDEFILWRTANNLDCDQTHGETTKCVRQNDPAGGRFN